MELTKIFSQTFFLTDQTVLCEEEIPGNLICVAVLPSVTLSVAGILTVLLSTYRTRKKAEGKNGMTQYSADRAPSGPKSFSVLYFLNHI